MKKLENFMKCWNRDKVSLTYNKIDKINITCKDDNYFIKKLALKNEKTEKLSRRERYSFKYSIKLSSDWFLVKFMSISLYNIIVA